MKGERRAGAAACDFTSVFVEQEKRKKKKENPTGCRLSHWNFVSSSWFVNDSLAWKCLAGPSGAKTSRLKMEQKGAVRVEMISLCWGERKGGGACWGDGTWLPVRPPMSFNSQSSRGYCYCNTTNVHRGESKADLLQRRKFNIFTSIIMTKVTATWRKNVEKHIRQK